MSLYNERTNDVLERAVKMTRALAYREMGTKENPWPMDQEELYMKWVASIVYSTYSGLVRGEGPGSVYFAVCDLPNRARDLLGSESSRVSILLPVEYETEEEKDVCAAAAKLLLCSLGAVTTAFVSDAWICDGYTDDPESHEVLPPSKRPDRKEAAVIVVESLAYDGVMASIVYTREGGKIVSVDAPSLKRVSVDTEFMGRFTGTLDHVFATDDVAVG